MSSSVHGSTTASGGAIFLLLQHWFCKIVIQRVFHRHVESGAEVFFFLDECLALAMVNFVLKYKFQMQPSR